jgi:hypothetical protein
VVWLVLFVGASAIVGGYASYTAQQAVIPKLQYRPGTPTEIVKLCREPSSQQPKATPPQWVPR